MIGEKDVSKAFWVAGTPELYPESSNANGIIPDEYLELVDYIRSLGMAPSTQVAKSQGKTE